MVKQIRRAIAEKSKTEGDHSMLQSLRVIERMDVGPIALEKKRLIAPYRIRQNGSEDTFSLIYRFYEDVFNPNEPASHNLACMIASQAAINYGLFCKEIIFHGLFDHYDRRFLEEMTQNTAREIYVKKFMEPNPYLYGIALSLPLVRLENYSQAKIVFTDPLSKPPKKRNCWDVDYSSCAVLSSGGKDSLLSFGLLHEIGLHTHPVFINESGRHWFTALNAYRYFKTTYPLNTRVWTNADRLFNWMLRHFPFIRKDFATIRSDQYPIRLWTVAVFLFGALPVLKKRKTGLLVIGDEYDTTRRLIFKKISHYDGLFDQSRYFDNALTRYFMRKEWRVCQFSVLRTLSEMLVEKILVQRYPHLQKHQVSCHAAHVKNDRVLPCGKCEKCRRIIGMLTAVGADHSHCGYTDYQVEQCLKNLNHTELHQESACIEQMLFLLKQKRGLEPQPKKTALAKPRPEVMKIRIDSERSPIEEIPQDLRKPLFAIFLEHADGAVRRNGRVWIACNPLDDQELAKPYIFGAALTMNFAVKSPEGLLPDQKKHYLVSELTWLEARSRFREVDIALLPVGSIEQHGPHLPLDTDAFDADYLAKQVASACGDPRPLVLPLLSYGVSYHHEDFSGTISISNETLSKLVYEIGMSVARNGITKLVIINGHGGNTPALQFASQMINRDAHIFTCVDTGETSDADVMSLCGTPNDVHAGEIETSMTLAVRPHLVQMEKAKKFIPEFSSHYLNFTSKRSIQWYVRTAKISRVGVMGDPTKANSQKGKKMWSIMIKNLVELVEDLKHLTLDEIYAKRY